MAISPTSPVAILNILELVLSIIVSGLISGVACLACGADGVYGLQFISGIVYGYLIINVFITQSIFSSDLLGKNLRMLVMGFGSVSWLCASAVILAAAASTTCCSSPIVARFLRGSYDRAVAGGILGLVNCVVYAIDAIYVFKKF